MQPSVVASVSDAIQTARATDKTWLLRRFAPRSDGGNRLTTRWTACGKPVDGLVISRWRSRRVCCGYGQGGPV